MRLAGAGIANQDHARTLLDVLTTHQFRDQQSIERWLRRELKIVERLVIGEPREAQSPLRTPLLAIE